jgi:hypothetical protein
MAKLDNNQQPPRKGRPPVKVDETAIRALFVLPQPLAAKALRISLTALKQVCRKLNIPRWPYQRGGTQQLAVEDVPRVAVGSRYGSETSTASTHKDTSRTNSSGSSIPDDDYSEADSCGILPAYACPSSYVYSDPNQCLQAQVFCPAESLSTTQSEGDDSDDDLFDEEMEEILAIDGPWIQRYAREALQFDSLLAAR